MMTRPGEKDSVIDAALLDSLLLASAPVAPAASRGNAMRHALMARIGSVEEAYVTIRADAGPWAALTTLVDFKLLSSDNGVHPVLIRLRPGAQLPEHRHGGDEECIVLSGEARLGDIRVRAGDYHLARAGSRHGVVSSDTGALPFLRTTQDFSPYFSR